MLCFYSKKEKCYISAFDNYGFWCVEFVRLIKIPVVRYSRTICYYTKSEIEDKYNRDFSDVLPDAFFKMHHGYYGLYLKENIDKFNG